MAARALPSIGTEGSSSFDPDQLLAEWDTAKLPGPEDNHLHSAISAVFGLSQTDDYVYHAVASVTLSQVQSAIGHGNANGMLAWYRDEQGQQVTRPSCFMMLQQG